MSQAVWTKDFEKISANVVTRETDDGFRYVDQAATEPNTLRIYTRLAQLGYVKGWL